jgi:hypothetical protein
MSARYHPLYDGLWNDDKLEGTPFEEKGFFAFLFGNPRQRPSGIYRVTDDQIAADTLLPLARVRRYLCDLDRRGRIVRDGVWLFVCGYFKRQPKRENLLAGVREDLAQCSSDRIWNEFAQRYPTVELPKRDRRPTVALPVNENASTEQSSTEQSSTEQSRHLLDPDRSPTVADNGWGRPEHLIELYNAASPSEAPAVKTLSPERLTKAKTYLAKFPERPWWEATFAQLHKSRFLRGLVKRPGHESFVADFDWLLTKGKDGTENCVKVHDGRYRDGA